MTPFCTVSVSRGYAGRVARGNAKPRAPIRGLGARGFSLRGCDH
jgi:hypothetical protein